jgi:hypothetical protein
MKDLDQKFGAMVAAIICFALVIAMIGGWKKDIARQEIVEFDIESIVVDDPIPLPEIETKEALLPEILPPLFEEPLPPLQGEV